MRSLTIVSLAPFLQSCAAPPEPDEPIAKTRGAIIGKIAVVNEPEHFVLIDLESSLYVPEPGENVRALRDNAETAHLKISREEKRPFVAADIIDGHPAAGDEIER
jgi:hypothetical protein